MAVRTLTMIAGNASTVFHAMILNAFASLSNNLFKTTSSFDGEPFPPPPPKTPVIASAIVEMVIERAVRIENMVIPCSRNKAQILSDKDAFLLRTFSRVCLVLATCV